MQGTPEPSFNPSTVVYLPVVVIDGGVVEKRSAPLVEMPESNYVGVQCLRGVLPAAGGPAGER